MSHEVESVVEVDFMEGRDELNRRFTNKIDGAKAVRYLDATLRKWDEHWPAQATPEQGFEVTASLEQLLADAQRQARAEQARQELVGSMGADEKDASTVQQHSPELG